MRFPGQRNAKHYFPVTRKPKRFDPRAESSMPLWYLVGLDQVLVDMEVQAPPGFTDELGLPPGESVGLSEAQFHRLLDRIRADGLSYRFAPGGTVTNTLNNYAFLSGEPSLLLGTIERCIEPHGPAFHYIAQTPKGVNLSHLRPVQGSVGTAITFISPGGDRSFAVAPGISTEYRAEDLPEEVIRGATAAVASLYTLADPSWPVAGATLRFMELASEAGVPVAFGLGTAGLVQRLRPTVEEMLQRYVTIASMNNREAEALTGLDDPLLACQRILDWVDLVIVTEGPEGMTIGGYTDEAVKRSTRDGVRSKSIPDYNQWEYSRLLRRDDCDQPLKIYTHIHPYHGGPERLANTSGAGDAALAAVLHDVAANRYHRERVPDSQKHTAGRPFLSYSSLSRNAQYGNRVAYEVLKGFSPRLDGPVGPDVGPEGEGDQNGGGPPKE